MASFARFPDLPNEIKLPIIETSDPEDVENLALCCKLVYSLADKTLRQHNEDKDTWSNLFFSLDPCRTDAECLEAFSKLREIATNRRLRRYPREVTIEGRNPLSVLPHHHEKQDDIINTCDKIFQDLESPYTDQAEMKAWHKRLIDSGITAGCSLTTSTVANTLLLTLLPNVERIIVSWHSRSSAEMSSIIRTISTVNRDAPIFMKNRLSLTKLIELHLCFDGRNINFNGATGVLEAFMTLPSLRTLRLTGVSPRFELNNFLDSTLRSNVTEIECLRCQLSATQLARLLDHVKCLRIFSYDQHELLFTRSIKKEGSPAALLDALFQYAKASLTYLNYDANAIIRGRGVELGDGSVDRIGPIDSFRGYEVLKGLRISCTLLFEDANEENRKRLINELPTSLEELELVGSISREDAQLMFAGMLEMKEERLPNLRYVVFDGIIPFDEETITAYGCAGLILDWRITDRRDARVGRFHKTNDLWIGGVEHMVG